MTRRLVLLVFLALAAGWLAYQTWSPQWQEQMTERAAIRRCKSIKVSEHLDLTQIQERHALCDAMQAAYDRKW
jgi:hypothetical protein